MYLKYLQIVNYKNLKSARFEFKKGSNTIVGENDSGKSNAMTALRILLDDTYYYSEKNLREGDFSEDLGIWNGHWIIISAFFDEITSDEKAHEGCKEIVPNIEDENFLKHYIRCEGCNFGTITLFIRPRQNIRKALYEAKNKKEFDEIRKSIKTSDYEFYYTARSQADFTNNEVYKEIVGDFEQGRYASLDENSQILGIKTSITDIWKYISVSFIDALRDVENELHKPKNPIRRIVENIQNEIKETDVEMLRNKIDDLNKTISEIKQISDIGNSINEQLNETIGQLYSPEIKMESKLKSEIKELSKNLAIIPKNKDSIEQLGLGHLNMIYVALKLVEFQLYREHELINIMIIEEPEAHIHTHIQRTLFENLRLSKEYTQVLMTTHSTHLSEVTNIDRLNVIKSDGNKSIVMNPIFELDEFGDKYLELKEGIKLSKCIERYLDSKRNTLLFSKSIILVEGDGEEILIPNLIKKVLGISLDEIGIGLVNIGSVAFEYIACLFDEKRIKKRCAIVTDLDKVLQGASVKKPGAERLGELRKEKLYTLFNNNVYVSMFYAIYTFEIEFANEEKNRKSIKKCINSIYIDQTTIQKHQNAIDGNEIERYNSIMTIASKIKKGWYATILSELIDEYSSIPEYIINAIAFSGNKFINVGAKLKIIKFALENRIKDEEKLKILTTLKNEEDKKQFVSEFIKDFPEDMASRFLGALIKNE